MPIKKIYNPENPERLLDPNDGFCDEFNFRRIVFAKLHELIDGFNALEARVDNIPGGKPLADVQTVDSESPENMQWGELLAYAREQGISTHENGRLKNKKAILEELAVSA